MAKRKIHDRALVFSRMFAALGHEVRLTIVHLLLSAHPDGMVVGEIQEELHVPGSTLSHHLKILEAEGLVTQTREERFLRYRAHAATFSELLGYLTAECCTRSQLVSFASLKKRAT